MWIRRIYRRGNSVMVTIPKAVRLQAPWAGAALVKVYYEGGRLVIIPMTELELLRTPRGDAEELPDDEAG